MWYQKKYSNFSEGAGKVLLNGKPFPPLKEYGTQGTEGYCMVNSIHALQIIIASNVSGSIRDLYSSSIRVTAIPMVHLWLGPLLIKTNKKH